MSQLISPSIPPNIASIFTEFGVEGNLADVRTLLMAGALMAYDNEMMHTDNAHLKHVGKNLISSDISLSKNLNVQVANISLETDLFSLGNEEKFDWVIFCDWFVAQGQPAICEATHQSEKTFQKDSWTTTFNRAGTKGFTILGHDRGVDRLHDLALNNNTGISVYGEPYDFTDGLYSYDAQNYLFDLSKNS